MACSKCVLPSPTPPYKNNGIVLRRGLLGHGLAGGMRQPIAVADDEGVEHVARVQAAGLRRAAIRIAIAVGLRVLIHAVQERHRFLFLFFVPHDEFYLNTATGDTREDTFDGGQQAVLQPFLRVGIGHGNGKAAIFIRHQRSRLDPCFKSGTRHFQLQLAQCSLPDLVGFHKSVLPRRRVMNARMLRNDRGAGSWLVDNKCWQLRRGQHCEE